MQLHPGPPSARHSSVTGPGRRVAVAGSRAEFIVTLRDSFGNACAMPSSGDNSGSSSSSAGGQTVKQDPFLVEVSPPVEPTLSWCCSRAPSKGSANTEWSALLLSALATLLSAAESVLAVDCSCSCVYDGTCMLDQPWELLSQ
jgi:hypothetical protein